MNLSTCRDSASWSCSAGSLALLGVFLLLVGGSLFYLFSSLVPYIFDPSANLSEYFLVSSSHFNSFHYWRFESISWLISQYLATNTFSAVAVHLTISALLFILGSWLLFSETNRAQLQSQAGLINFFWTASGFTLFYTILVFWFATDFVLLSAITWIPLTGFAALKFAQGTTRSALWFVIFVVFLSRVSESANQLFLPILIFCLTTFGILALVAQLRGTPITVSARAQLVIIVIILAALIASARVPFPDFAGFSYPPQATLVPDDGGAGLVRPLVGPDPGIKLLNRENIRAALAIPAKWVIGFSLLVLLLAGVRAWVSRKHETFASLDWCRAVGVPLIALSIATIGTLADIFLNEELARIAPALVLARVAPGASLLTLTPLFFGLALLSCYWLVVSIWGPFRALLVMILLFSSIQVQRGAANDSLLISPNLVSPSRLQLSALNAEQLKKFLSPSLFFFSSFSKPYIAPIADGSELVRLKVKMEIQTSNPAAVKGAKRMRDQRDDTRWGSGGGGQDGTEWIYLRLAEPVSVTGITLQPGAFFSDYPRGLEISNLASCPEVFALSELENHKRQVLFAQPRWLGSPRLSSAGFGYFTSQSDVFPIFAHSQTVECLLIRQLGKEPLFDWSVAELALYGETK